MNLYKTYRLSSIIKLSCFLAVLTVLFCFSKENFDSAKRTITLFLFSVLPSLFPFILFTEIILQTDLVSILSKILGNFVKKVFRIHKNSTSSIIIGFLCGFPMGAKSVIHSLENGYISHKEATFLLSFINNCNPIFILSTIALSLFGSIQIGVILLVSHVVSALLLGLFFSRLTNPSPIILKKKENLKGFSRKREEKSPFNTFELLKNSIKNAFRTLEMILGFMLIFNLLANICSSILSQLHLSPTIVTILTSLFEVTNGCSQISTLPLPFCYKLSLISLMLGFSGFCIIFQIYSVISSHGFSLKQLCLFKCLHGIISGVLTYSLLILLNLEAKIPVTIESFANLDTNRKTLTILPTNLKIYGFSLFFLLCFLWLFFYSIKKHKKVVHESMDYQ